MVIFHEFFICWEWPQVRSVQDESGRVPLTLPGSEPVCRRVRTDIELCSACVTMERVAGPRSDGLIDHWRPRETWDGEAGGVYPVAHDWAEAVGGG